MAKSKASVLMLLMSLDIGGVETSVISLAKGMQALGWKVYVASKGGKRVKDLEKAEITHFTVPLHSRWPLNMARAHKSISKIVSTCGIDLIHAHARIPIWISEKIAADRNIPFVATYHGRFKSGFPWVFFSRPGDKTIAVSTSVKEYIVKEFGFDPQKVTVIPNGIDVGLFRPEVSGLRAKALHSFDIPEERKPVVTYASRLDGDLAKAAIIAQEAVAKLKNEYPEIMLLVAGDGKDFDTVKLRAEQINASCGKERVRCLGFVLDTPLLYAASDMVLGMSRVALEAMALAKPVIIFGPSGIFGPVSPQNVKALEERNYVSLNAPFPSSPQILKGFIDELLKNPEIGAQLGGFGRQRVLEAHSEESVAISTEKIYLSLLKSS